MIEYHIWNNIHGKLEEVNNNEVYDEGMVKGDVPITILEPKQINGLHFQGTLKALLDSGASVTCVQERVLPFNCSTYSIETCSVQGFGGMQELNEAVDLQDVALPEFGRSFRIDNIKALVFRADTHYDIIIGRDVLQPAGFTLDFGDYS